MNDLHLPQFLIHFSNFDVATWLVASVIASYFCPAIMAYGRSHHDRLTILIMNLLLGWTVLGWVVALVWAATSGLGDSLGERQIRAIRQEPTLDRDARRSG